MGHRKIKVDGQVFEYSFGKTHTKIEGLGEYVNEEVGIWKVDYVESYGGEHVSLMAWMNPDKLASFIRENKR